MSRRYARNRAREAISGAVAAKRFRPAHRGAEYLIGANHLQYLRELQVIDHD